ncbi:hypothetical protein [Kiloniella sp. b19]|uniref:hypothetical protein n=1 Tax=Kiloniella sp. GXU_MW_B19 TaxID=3141326 RepID=UPI0031E342C6
MFAFATRFSLLTEFRMTRGRSLLALLAAVVLSGCQTTPSPSGYAHITFGHKGTFNLVAQELVIEQEYLSPAQAPNVEHIFPIPPALTAEQWALDRLRASGVQDNSRLVYRVLEASVIEEKIEPGEETLESFFRKDPTEAYTGKIRVNLSLEDARGFTLASVNAQAERKMTALPDLTLNEREALWFSMTEKLMAEIDQQLETAIPQHFGKYLQ